MAYWIFKCNPGKYRLSERLDDPNLTITWTVSRYRDQINPGDTVFLWETGPDRGIRALFRVESAPKDMPEFESEQAYWVERDTEVRCRVVGILTHRDVHLPSVDLRSVPGLEDLSVFHGFQQSTNFVVTSEQGPILLRLVEAASS
jgi:hypothetical protein